MRAILPTRSDLPSYSYSIDIDDNVYILEFNFNYRMQRWFMSIKDSDGNPIISGIILLSNWLLTQRFVDTRLPLGDIMLLNYENDTPPNRNELGSKAELIYSTER